MMLQEPFDLAVDHRIGSVEPLPDVFPQLPMQILRVDAVHRVFLALQPVARDLRSPHLAECVLRHEWKPAWNQRRRRWTEIGPHESTQLLNRVRTDLDLFVESTFGRL